MKPRSETLFNPLLLQQRIALLESSHILPLEAWRRAQSATGPLPHFDPVDGGVNASLLLLLETPGPSVASTRFVSCDNPTGTAANLRRFLAMAMIDRRQIVLWNAVPWHIHAPGAVNRAPQRQEITVGLTMLPGVLERLPRLKVIVLAGRVAAMAHDIAHEARPDLPILSMPHPSPTYVNTHPDIAVRIANTFEKAAMLLRCHDARENPASCDDAASGDRRLIPDARTRKDRSIP